MNRLSETFVVLAIAAGGIVLATAVSGARPSPSIDNAIASNAKPLQVAMGDRWPSDRYRDDRAEGRAFAGGGVCEPADALRQAKRAGLRDAGVKNVSPDDVVVGGFRRGGYDEVVLINRSGCPFD